jgi:hypothetical protein
MMASLTPGDQPGDRRPYIPVHSPSAPVIMTAANGHFASVGDGSDKQLQSFEHGIQVIDENKEYNTNLPAYLDAEHVLRQGFNYHLISVFGSQSTGKSTLLNHLFGTHFGVMSESERRQTTKGIWMSKNKRDQAGGGAVKMADNILVMDVEGTDGRERGEDQDFERKSALFALATSEVLIVNIWEHQVGLYQGANMGLLKTVFEVNLQLFLKDNKYEHAPVPYFGLQSSDSPLSQFHASIAPLLCHSRPHWHHSPIEPASNPSCRPYPHLVHPL